MPPNDTPDIRLPSNSAGLSAQAIDELNARYIAR